MNICVAFAPGQSLHLSGQKSKGAQQDTRYKEKQNINLTSFALSISLAVSLSLFLCASLLLVLCCMLGRLLCCSRPVSRRACNESWPESAASSSSTTTTDVGIFQRREIKQATQRDNTSLAREEHEPGKVAWWRGGGHYKKENRKAAASAATSSAVTPARYPLVNIKRIYACNF